MRLLTPIPVDRRPRRFVQLIIGLLLYGFTMGMMVRAVLGLDPWDVFHQGLTALIDRWIPLSYGTVITIVSVFVLLLWIPLRQRPGIGTVANAAIIGCPVALKCLSACMCSESSQHPTWPQLRQRRSSFHVAPIAMQSTQPLLPGLISRISLKCSQRSAIVSRVQSKGSGVYGGGTERPLARPALSASQRL